MLTVNEILRCYTDLGFDEEVISHVIRVQNLCKEFFDIPGLQKELLLNAAILHDMPKKKIKIAIINQSM